MITPRSGTSRRFQELARQQCYQLLGTQEVARAAWQAADALQILPVTYTLFEGAIYFRTSQHSIVSELARPTAPLENLSQRWELESLMPWAAGLRTLVAKVVPFDMSGRMLRRYVDM